MGLAMRQEKTGVKQRESQVTAIKPAVQEADAAGR
jgi:hypothetical protein